MDLFGKQKLRDRIDSLETQIEEKEQQIQELRERLEQRNTKEAERAKKAEAAKQEAERKLNRYRDKIRALKDRLGDEEDTEQLERDLQTHRLPTVTDLLNNLDRLEFRHSTAITAYRSKDTTDSRNSSVAFLCRPLLARILIPPLPVDDETYRAAQFNTDQLRDMLDSRYCLIHLSAGGSGAALIEEQEPQQTVLIDADIKAEHKKGGYSQSRFERIRDEQIEQHIETVIQQTQQLIDQGFDRLLLTGNDDMRSQYRKKTENNVTQLKADTSSIQKEQDLKDAFNAAMSFRSRQLDPHEIDSLLNS